MLGDQTLGPYSKIRNLAHLGGHSPDYLGGHSPDYLGGHSPDYLGGHSPDYLGGHSPDTHCQIPLWLALAASAC
jgi:hypothetical protein